MHPPGYKGSMKRIVILAIVIVVVFGGWSAAWLAGSGFIRSNIGELAKPDGESAPKVACDRLDVGGYPFWFDVVCNGLTVVSGDITATAPVVKAQLLVYDPWHLVATATGPLTLNDAFTGAKTRLDWQKIEASARLTGWRIARISVLAETLALNDTVAGDNLLAKASHGEFHLLDIPEQHDAAKGLAALALYAKLDDLNAPGFQINNGRSTLEADITGLSDDVRTYGDADILTRWQAAGGSIKLVGLKGDDGDTQHFDVNGTLGLDAAMHPAGQLTVASKGLVERFGSMIPEQMRPLVLGNPGADGSYSQVLNLTNGVLFSGLVPLGPLPAIQ
jgi:hypothetical protein